MSVQYGIVTAVMPPGGWHYPQKLSSGDTVKIEAFSFEEILETILDFRRRHMDLCGSENATIEKVRADLKQYMCANFRQNCADNSSVPAQTGIHITNYKTPIDRTGSWLAELGHTRIERIDAGLASQRAQICCQCPQNVRWQTGCQSCNDNVAIRIQNANGSLYTPYDRRLQACRVYGWANAVAVWLADPVATAEHEPPAHCWVK